MGIADDIRAKQQQAAASAGNLRKQQVESFESLRRAIEQVVPEIAQLCRELKLKNESRSKFKTSWTFGANTTIEISPSGKWIFVKPTYGKLATRDSWTDTRIFAAPELRAMLIQQVESKALHPSQR